LGGTKNSAKKKMMGKPQVCIARFVRFEGASRDLPIHFSRARGGGARTSRGGLIGVSSRRGKAAAGGVGQNGKKTRPTKGEHCFAGQN